MPGAPLPFDVGSDSSADCEGGIHGRHGGRPFEKGEKAERRYVVWKGVHSRPLCRATGSVFIPSSASFLGKQPDPGDDGSDDFYSFKLYSRLQADETGGRRAEGRIAAFKECQRLLPFILELCDLV